MFNSEDLRQIAAHGLSVESVEQQIENFKRGFPFLKVVRAASVGDGVRALGGEELSLVEICISVCFDSVFFLFAR